MLKFELESEGTVLHLCEYTPETMPLGVVQIAHGMEEHCGRYAELAEYLTSRGFIVITADLRGHGEDTPEADRGWFSDRDGHKLLLADQMNIREYIAGKYPEFPIMLLAHSMSSIITRVLLKTESRKWSRVALIGYPNYNKFAPFGILFANIVQSIKGARYKSKFIKFLSVKVFNQKIDKPSGEYDWISVNRENSDAFTADPLCGFGFTIAGMRDLFTLVIQMHDCGGCDNVRRKLPILLLSGAEDPCTGGDEGRLDSFETLQTQGFSRITMMTIPNMRHEILHENENQEVFKIIGDFFEL